jgi:hypothetical protein
MSFVLLQRTSSSFIERTVSVVISLVGASIMLVRDTKPTSTEFEIRYEAAVLIASKSVMVHTAVPSLTVPESGQTGSLVPDVPAVVMT